MVLRASWALTALGAAAGIQSSAGDALFIQAFGPKQLGTAFAASSIVLMLILGYLGTIADRRSRRAVLLWVCVGSGLASLLVAFLASASIELGGAVAVVAGKQMAAASDLALWVLLAQRLSPTAIRRNMGRFVIHHGVGIVGGALLVGPLARGLGLDWAFGFAALAFICAAALFLRASPLQRALPGPRAAKATAQSLLRPFYQSGLARGLAVVVFAGGLFAPILYYLAAGAVASANPGDSGGVAETLGWFRGATQVATLFAQIAVTPYLLSRLGVAGALRVAPTVAVVGAGVVLAFPLLGTVLTAQALVRVFDSACDDPAEKLAMNLLPADVRGRVGGALDGIAKRAGSVLGGLMASVLAYPVLLWVTTLTAGLWAAFAYRFSRRLPQLAVSELAAREDSPGAVASNFADPRGQAKLLEELRGLSVETAVELVAELSRSGRANFARAIAQALADPDCRAPQRLYQHAVLVALQQPEAVAHALSGFEPVGELSTAWIAHCRAAMDGESDDSALGLAFTAVGAAHRGDASISQLVSRLLRRHRRAEPGAQAALASALATCAGAGQSSDAEWILSRSALLDAARTWPEDYQDASPAHVAHRVAAIRVLGAVASRDTEDAEMAARLLADGAEVVAGVASRYLESCGQEALEPLLVAASVGRRRGRERALSLLRQLPAHHAELDALIERELIELADTTTRLPPLATLPAGELLRRRLRERVTEIVRTLLMAIEARYRDSALGDAGRLVLAARSVDERARPLEVLHASLPGAFRDSVVAALGEGDDVSRAKEMARLRGIPLPSVDESVSAELAGRDPLARALAVHALGQEGRSRFRDEINEAASNAARTYDAAAIVQKLVGDASWDEEMPSQVETLLALRDVELFTELTTRELAELASVVTWFRFAPGERVLEEGDAGDAMYFVLSGQVRVTQGAGADEVAVLGPGEPFGELSLFEDLPRNATVSAESELRVGRIHRNDFGELVDQIPGIALAICRVLSRRLRAYST